MTIETLEKRIASCKEKMDKKSALYAKKSGWIEKKNAALKALGYDYYREGDKEKIIENYRNGNTDAYWLWSDIDTYQQDLKDITKESLRLADEYDQLNAMLIEAHQKANSRNVPAIIEFLEAWKQRVMNHYTEAFDEYYTDLQRCRDAQGTSEYEALSKQFDEDCRGVTVRENTKYGYVWKKVKEGKYEFIYSYVHWATKEAAVAKLEKELEREKNRKYDFIIERTNKIVGEITDASNLRVGAKDDLNGIIYGTNGKAKVQTIGAGGYNTDIIVNEKHGQCFHFRTLIDEVK